MVIVELKGQSTGLTRKDGHQSSEVEHLSELTMSSTTLKTHVHRNPQNSFYTLIPKVTILWIGYTEFVDSLPHHAIIIILYNLSKCLMHTRLTT